MLNTLISFLPDILAQASGGGADVAAIKKIIGFIGALMAAFGCIYGVILIWQGGQAKAKGDPNAYHSIEGGAWVALAFLLIGGIMAVAGLGDFVVKPQW